MEAHGQLVMENSSPEETAHVQAELDQLKESWKSLKENWKSCWDSGVLVLEKGGEDWGMRCSRCLAKD